MLLHLVFRLYSFISTYASQCNRRSKQYDRNNPSLNVYEFSSISLKLFAFACLWGSGYFKVNELYTRKLEELPTAYTLPKQNKNPCNGKITMFHSNIFGSACIDGYILIPGRILIFISKI